MASLRALWILAAALLLCCPEMGSEAKRPPPKKTPASRRRPPPPKKTLVLRRPPPPLTKLMCHKACFIRGRAIAARGKKSILFLEPSRTAAQCLSRAAKAKAVYYQYLPKSGKCFGFMDCKYTVARKTVLTGLVSTCAKIKKPPPPRPRRLKPPPPRPRHAKPPPPAVKTFCSSSYDGPCRCPQNSRCEKRKGIRKVCCCTPEVPIPIIKKRTFYGCRK